MATEYFETACNSHNIGGFAVNYSGDEIVDNITGFLGNNGGGDQLAPESVDLDRQLAATKPLSLSGVDPSPPQSGWWLGSHAGSLVTGHNDVQLPNDLALGAGDYLGNGLNALAAYLATSFPEVATGGNLTGNAFYNTSASFYDENLAQPTPDWNSIPSFAIPPVVDVGQLQSTAESNPLPASITTHGVDVKLPKGRFACLCGETFTRSDSRKRHIDGASRRHPSGVQTPGGLFPCMYCDKHHSANGFARRDNLRQHLKGYHKMNSESIDAYFRTYH